MTILGDDGRVEFRFFRPGVREVRIVGDFNGGSTTLPMHRCDERADGPGWWSARAMFGGGEYRFRYVADGQWFTDFASNGVEAAKTGFDSILVIPQRDFQRGGAKETLAQGMVA